MPSLCHLLVLGPSPCHLLSLRLLFASPCHLLPPSCALPLLYSIPSPVLSCTLPLQPPPPFLCPSVPPSCTLLSYPFLYDAVVRSRVLSESLNLAWAKCTHPKPPGKDGDNRYYLVIPLSTTNSLLSSPFFLSLPPSFVPSFINPFWRSRASYRDHSQHDSPSPPLSSSRVTHTYGFGTYSLTARPPIKTTTQLPIPGSY